MSSDVSRLLRQQTGDGGRGPTPSDASAGTTRARRPASYRLVLGAAALALLVSCGVVAVGGSPALLLVLAVALSTLALRRWLSTTLALAVVLTGALALLAVTMRLWPALGVPVTWMLVLPALVGAASLGLLWRGRTAALDVRRGDLVLGVLLAGLSVVQVLAVPAARWLTDRPKLAWMMKNDSAWNLVATRYLVDDEGLDPSSHRNPAPLANELVALFLAPGRSALEPTELLAHDLLRASQALLLLVAATSLLSGLLVASRIPVSLPRCRVVLAAVAAVIPWTWWFAGQVFVFGFWNSLPAAVLVLVLWAAWTGAERSPRAASALLALSGTGLLAAWAPLVVVPAALGLAVVVRHARSHLSLRGVAAVAWTVPLVVLAAYAVLVTGADFAASSEGLAMEGLFPAYGEHLPPVYWLVPLAVLLLLSTYDSSRWDLVGVVVVGIAGAVGTLYLMGQREGSLGGPWGYYPQKFAWTLSLLAPIVLLTAVAGPLAAAGLRRTQRGSLVLGTLLVTAVMLLLVPPGDPRPQSALKYPLPHRTPDYRLTSLLPTLSILFPDRASAMDPAARSLLALQDPRTKVVASRWSEDPGDNGFLNFWLLQLPLDQAGDHPHNYAYGLDSFDPAQLCALVRDWGEGVVIRTRSEALPDELAAACPGGGFEVRVDTAP